MPVQYNTERGGLMYAPSRDIRYMGVELVRETVRRFNDQMWPELQELLTANGVTWEKLCDVMDAYQQMLATACHDPAESFHDVLKRVGWYKVEPVGHVALMAMLGVVFSGAMFNSLRDTTPLGDEASLDIRDLCRNVDEMCKALTERKEPNGGNN